jgi:hypothetical protein
MHRNVSGSRETESLFLFPAKPATLDRRRLTPSPRNAAPKRFSQIREIPQVYLDCWQGRIDQPIRSTRPDHRQSSCCVKQRLAFA